MYARAEVSEQYKQAVREYLRQSSEFSRGRMSGLATSLGCLGVSISKIDEMCHICEEEVIEECESTETMIQDAQQPLANIRAEVRKALESKDACSETEQLHQYGKALAKIESWHKEAGPISQGTLEKVLRIFKEETGQ